MTPKVHILILAAGASSRMRGADKLLEPISGVPALRHIAIRAADTASPVVVAMPPDRIARNAAITDLPLRLVEVPDAGMGMSRSLARGISAVETEAGGNDGLMVVPADMPDLTTSALQVLIAEFCRDPSMIVRGASADGRPGHPVVFPRDLWRDLSAVSGDEGGRSVLKNHQSRVRVIPLPGQMAILDLDTPEDWQAWRTHQA